MLFERQRLLLTLLDAIGGPIGHTDFQKLLFLYTREYEDSPSYDFVPYRFGGFSFTSYADRRKLVTEGLVGGDEQHWGLTDAGRDVVRLRAVTPLRAAGFGRQYARLRGDALIVEQYRRYPYYASRSEILDRLPLEPEDLARIAEARPKRLPAGIVTIGYEGRSLECYLNDLLNDGVTMLCDVRRNPLSRKYGFSKGTLGKACEGVGIRYTHVSDLGIASEQRQILHDQADYDALFAEYERTSLPDQAEALKVIHGWVTAGDRVALTCYERLPQQCHRHGVAEALDRMGGGTFKTHHL